MFVCPKCKKPYKKNGFWIRKHMIEVCHVKSLNPTEFIENFNIEKIVNLVLKRLNLSNLTKVSKIDIR